MTSKQIVGVSCWLFTDLKRGGDWRGNNGEPLLLFAYLFLFGSFDSKFFINLTSSHGFVDTLIGGLKNGKCKESRLYVMKVIMSYDI